ncbi:uncharacterized protein mbl isoform X10 [Bemisia tabaci]|uniref:uncharacterized protein mbl isoform X10 n=1 Tax=Bemisia tabaci TaxID=7038 RepID=UPI003B27E739
MANMVNMNNLLNGKDSRWLQLEVCREFQRNKCTRPDTECKFAHPPTNVEVLNGRVTACYDSIKVSFTHYTYRLKAVSQLICKLRPYMVYFSLFIPGLFLFFTKKNTQSYQSQKSVVYVATSSQEA